MSFSRIQKITLQPDNAPNSVSNSFSFKEGSTLIQFSMGPQDVAMLTGSVRLNFTCLLKTSSGEDPNNNAQNNDTNIPAPRVNTQVDSGVGVASVIQSIQIQNFNNLVCERVNHYGRMLATLLPVQQSFNDYINYLPLQYGAVGHNTQAEGRMNNRPFSVSMPLLVGMFADHSAIPLASGGRGINGFRLSIQLAPDVAVLFGENNEALNSSYQLRNVSLSFDVGVPEGGRLPPIRSLPYSAFSSFYSIIRNGDETTRLNVSLGAVKSQFSNFSPADRLSSYSHNGMRTQGLQNSAGGGAVSDASIKQLTFLRAGVKYPELFKVDETRTISQPVGAGFENNYDALRCATFLNAVRPLEDNYACLAGEVSEGLRTGQPQSTFYINQSLANDNNLPYNTPGERVFGIGCRYDQLNSGASASFSNKAFSQRIQSELDGSLANGVFSFFLHRNNLQIDTNGNVALVN